MSHVAAQVRGFRAVFTTIGVIYVLLGSSMLVRGVVVLRDFGVPEHVVASPVLEDFFLFFYQLMVVFGVLMVLFGHVTRERSHQLLVARVFCALNVLTAFRDLSTSDSRFGNRLYQGEETLLFVLISITFAIAFGVLAFGRSRPASAAAGQRSRG